jgi:alkylated DNA repair dioxygenase AlkB
MAAIGHKSRTNLLPRDGEMYFLPDAIATAPARKLFDELRESIAFKRETGLIFGRRQRLPRETAWFGEAGYRYSGVSHPPVRMPDCLLPLKLLAENLAGCGFNSVLLNHYRDGRDSVSWHSDDKGGIGPVIASLSLGATRRFLVRHRDDKDLRLALELTSGSCLIMASTMQQYWQHSVPKVRHAEPRINLTFRLIARGPVNGP